jgi:hypothetical protein
MNIGVFDEEVCIEMFNMCLHLLFIQFLNLVSAVLRRSAGRSGLLIQIKYGLFCLLLNALLFGLESPFTFSCSQVTLKKFSFALFKRCNLVDSPFLSDFLHKVVGAVNEDQAKEAEDDEGSPLAISRRVSLDQRVEQYHDQYTCHYD